MQFIFYLMKFLQKFFHLTKTFTNFFSFNEIIKKLEGEIIDDYKKSLRYSIVDYILLDANERKRLLIETMPVEYPVLVIRAPVPWHQYKILADHFMEHNLFITNEILKDIRDLWFSKLLF